MDQVKHRLELAQCEARQKEFFISELQKQMLEMVDSRDILLVQPLKKSKPEARSKLENTINAALLAEQLIDDLKQTQEHSQAFSALGQLEEQWKQLKAESLFLVEQRQTMQQQISAMKQDSDNVKAKFTTLLDEFQEFIQFEDTQKVKTVELKSKSE